MRILLAGVPAEIVSRYRSNQRFFDGYQTDLEPAFVVDPSEEDMVRALERIRATDEAEGIVRAAYPGAFVENCAIHAILAEKLLKHGVLLMHGSSLAMDGRGYIFTAPSGTGKSTHARLWREVYGNRVTMIDDDKPLLRFEKELPKDAPGNGDGKREGDRGTGNNVDGNDGPVRITVCGTPWNGKHRLGANVSAPLDAVAFLSRSEVNSVSPVSTPDAFMKLMKQVYLSDDPASMGLILDMVKTMTRSLRFYDLKCNMEPDAARVSFEGMSRKDEATQAALTT